MLIIISGFPAGQMQGQFHPGHQQCLVIIPPRQLLRGALRDLGELGNFLLLHITSRLLIVGSGRDKFRFLPASHM